MAAEMTMTDHNDGSDDDIAGTVTNSNGTATFHVPGHLRVFFKERYLVLLQELGVRIS